MRSYIRRRTWQTSHSRFKSLHLKAELGLWVSPRTWTGHVCTACFCLNSSARSNGFAVYFFLCIPNSFSASFWGLWVRSATVSPQMQIFIRLVITASPILPDNSKCVIRKIPQTTVTPFRTFIYVQNPLKNQFWTFAIRANSSFFISDTCLTF